MRIIEDNQLSTIFLQAQQNLAKMLLGDYFLLLMYLCKSQMRQRGPQTLAGSLGKQRASFRVVAPRNRQHQCHVFKQLEAGESEQSSTRQIPLLILCLFRFFPFLLGAGIRREGAWAPTGSPASSARSPEACGKRYLGSSTFHTELHLHPGICQPLQQLLQIQGKDDTKRYTVPAGF